MTTSNLTPPQPHAMSHEAPRVTTSIMTEHPLLRSEIALLGLSILAPVNRSPLWSTDVSPPPFPQPHSMSHFEAPRVISSIVTEQRRLMSEVTCLAAYVPSDNGHPRLVFGRNGVPSVDIYCSATGTLLGNIPGFGQSEVAVYDTTDGKPRIVTGSQSGRVRFVDGDSFEAVGEHLGIDLGHISAMMVCPDGTTGAPRSSLGIIRA
jgi:hypothetical protein